MSFLRLIILGLVFLFFRRLYLAVKKLMGGDPPQDQAGTRSDRDGPPSPREFREEDISDADFEEIP